MQASFDDASLSYAMSAVAVVRDAYNPEYDLPVPLSRFVVEATAVDPDALHVLATDLVLVGRWPSGKSLTLADLDPFQVMAPSQRSWLVEARGTSRATCGYHAALSVVQARLVDHARDGRIR